MPRRRPRHRLGWEADWLAFIAKNHVPADFDSTHTYGVTKAIRCHGQDGTVLDTSPDSHRRRVRDSRDRIDHAPPPTSSSTTPSGAPPATPPPTPSTTSTSKPPSSSKNSAPPPPSRNPCPTGPSPTSSKKAAHPSPLLRRLRPHELQGIRKPSYFAYKFLAQLGPTDIATNDPRPLLGHHQTRPLRPNPLLELHPHRRPPPPPTTRSSTSASSPPNPHPTRTSPSTT